jgi:hypothetical protein
LPDFLLSLDLKSALTFSMNRNNRIVVTSQPFPYQILSGRIVTSWRFCQLNKNALPCETDNHFNSTELKKEGRCGIKMRIQNDKKNSYPFSIFFMKGLKRSIGIGKSMVELFSVDISESVCKKRNCKAAGSFEIITAASESF